MTATPTIEQRMDHLRATCRVNETGEHTCQSDPEVEAHYAAWVAENSRPTAMKAQADPRPVAYVTSGRQVLTIRVIRVEPSGLTVVAMPDTNVWSLPSHAVYDTEAEAQAAAARADLDAERCDYCDTVGCRWQNHGEARDDVAVYAATAGTGE